MAFQKKIQVRKVLRSILFSLFLFISGIIGMVFLSMALFNFTPLQSVINTRIEKKLAARTGIHIEIGRIQVLRKLSLENFILMDNRADTLVHIGQLRTGIGLFPLLDRTIVIRDIHLSDSRFAVHRPASSGQFNFQVILDSLSSPGKDTTRQRPWQVSIRRVILEEIHAAFDDRLNGISAASSVGRLELAMDLFDLEGLRFDLGSFSLENIRLSYNDQMGALSVSSEIGELTLSNAHVAAEDRFAEAAGLLLSGSRFSLHDRKRPPLERGLDPGHLELEGIHTEIRNIKLDSSLSATILNLGATEKNGISLDHLQGTVKLQQERIRIVDFQLQTPRTALSSDGLFITDPYDPQKMTAEVHLDGSLHTGDLIYAVPGLYGHLPDTMDVAIFTDAKKKERTVTVKALDIQTPDAAIRGYGSISGWEDPGSITTDSVHLRLMVENDALAYLLPANESAGDFRIPPEIALTLNVNGKVSNLEGNAGLNTSFGDVHAGITADTLSGAAPIHLNGELEIENLNLENLLVNPQLGLLDGDFSFLLRGNDWQSLAGQVSGIIEQLDYAGYTYRRANLDGSYDGRMLSAGLSIRQPEIALQFSGNAGLSGGIQSLAFRMNLERADFGKLNAGPRDIVASGVAEADIRAIGRESLEGTLGIGSLVLQRGEARHEIDSIRMVSTHRDSISDFMVSADFLDFSYSGNVSPLGVPSAVPVLAARYPVPGRAKDTTAGKDSLYSMKFKLDLHDDRVLSEVFIPGLEEIEINELEGGVDDYRDTSFLTADIPAVRYGGIDLRSLRAKIDAVPGHVHGFVQLNELDINELTVSDVLLEVLSRDGEYRLRLEIPRKDTSFLQIVADVGLVQDRPYLRLLADSLVLNGRHWQAHPDNRLYLNPPYGVEHFVLQDQEQLIRILSRDEGEGITATRIEVRNFNLRSFGGVFQSAHPLISGKMHADLELPSGRRYFTGDVRVDSLKYLQAGFGDLHLQAAGEEGGTSISLELGTPGSQAMVIGSLSGEDMRRMNLRAELREFDLNTLHPLTGNVARTLKGRISGNLMVEGTMSVPDVRGALQMDEIEVFPDALNTWLYIDDETIEFQKNAIIFTDFEILDANRNPAVLNGMVRTEAFPEIKLDLDLTTADFLAINTENAGDDIFYGKIIIDSETEIQGTPASLNINSNAVLKDGTDVHVIVPESQEEVLRRSGMVRFASGTVDSVIFQPATDTLREEKQVTGGTLDLQAGIGIEENSRLNILIDQEHGDHLALEGGGNLSLRLRPGGDVSLSGRYEINDGLYRLNFQQLARREFQILDDSYIQWTGEPTDANLSINARNSIETRSPVPDVPARLPFRIDIQIGGELLQPELQYGLSMPPGVKQQYGQVDAYIRGINRDESELNKQVMSLILFNSFMPRKEVSGSGGLDVSGAARSSLSRFITEQINRVSPGIEGFEIDLDLESYETQNEEDVREAVTNLEVGLSQALFNERLKILVAGDVYLENREGESQEVLEYLDNVMVEYEFTDEGDLRLVGFRDSDFDELSQGNYTKTGIGVIYVKEFDRLKELFRKKREEHKGQVP